MSKSATISLSDLLTLTVAEAALLTGIPREYLDAEIRADRLKPMDIPGVRRVSRVELDRWIAARTTAGTIHP